MKLRSLYLLMALALCSAGASADATLDSCLLCHGTNVNGNVSIRAPKLAGLSPSYVLRQLQAFRAGTRGTHAQDVSGGEMRTIALSLDAPELGRIVEFVTKQPAQRPGPSVDGDINRGKQLYAACAACHGSRGEGNETLQGPALAAGSDWYFVVQLSNYRNGLRGTAPGDTYGATMRAAASALPDEQSVRDVVAYINTIQ